MKNSLVCVLLSAGLATACNNRHEPVHPPAHSATGNTVENKNTNTLADSTHAGRISDQMIPNNTGPVVLPGASHSSTKSGEKTPQTTSW